jgi:hypothetical protein
MAAGGGGEKSQKLFGKHFETSPVVLASAHGAYYIQDDLTPFKVPPNVYIVETQTAGDYCLTSIDEYIWNLFQGPNRKFLHALGRGKSIDAEGKAYIDVMKNLTFYKPGDTIFDRVLSIGGGRGSGPGGGGSSRYIYANMGFYFFPAEATAINTFPHGPKTKFLGELRTKMIEDANVQLTYQEFIEYTFRLYPELRNGCIFVFSSCAGYFNTGASSKKAFGAKLYEIHQAQQAARLNFIKKSGYGAGGAIESKNLDAAGGGGGAAKSATPYALRSEPAEFAPSAFGPNAEDRMSALADKYWAEQPVPEREHVPLAQPAGTRQIFEYIGGKNPTYKQLFVEGTKSPFWTPNDTRAHRRANPAQVLMELKGGEFVEVPKSGGRRRPATRRNKSSRKTRKSRK